MVLALQDFHLPDHGGPDDRLCASPNESTCTALAILRMYVRYKSDANTRLMKRTSVRCVLYTHVLLVSCFSRMGEIVNNWHRAFEVHQ